MPVSLGLDNETCGPGRTTAKQLMPEGHKGMVCDGREVEAVWIRPFEKWEERATSTINGGRRSYTRSSGLQRFDGGWAETTRIKARATKVE